MNRSETIGKVMDALRRAQLEFDPVLKNTNNPLYNHKYAQLDGVISATQPALAKHDLVVSQLAISDLDQQGSGVSTFLVHSSGEFISGDFLLPAAGHGKDKSVRYDAQTACAAVTYARRYAYLAIINIASEDDDGNQAAGYADGKSTSNNRQNDIPDFQEARHATPRPAATQTPKQGTECPTAAQERPAGPPSETIDAPIAPPPPPVPAEKQNQGPAVAPDPTPAPREPGDEDDSLPTEAELTEYRKKFSKLGDELSTAGKLKASKGLPINRKLLVFLLDKTGATDAKTITAAQWDSFFQRVQVAVDNPAVGLVGLAKLVNAANGIEDKK
jgi:hypothetical protein